MGIQWRTLAALPERYCPKLSWLGLHSAFIDDVECVELTLFSVRIKSADNSQQSIDLKVC